jgi:hypothetical protein
VESASTHRHCSGALQLQQNFEVCKMWEGGAIIALLMLCIGVMYAWRQVARMEKRLQVLLEIQSERAQRMQTEVQGLRAHAIPQDRSPASKLTEFTQSFT